MESTLLREKSSCKVHKEMVTGIEVPDDGNSEIFYTCSRDKKAYKWKLQPSESSIGHLIKSYEGHKHFISSIVCANDVLITGSNDKTVRIYGDNEIILRNHTDDITCVSVNHDKNKIITGSIDGTVCLWNSEGILSHVFNFNSWVMCASFVPLNSDVLVVGLYNGILKVLNVDTKEEIHMIKEDSEIKSISITPDGSFCAYGTKNYVKIINLKNFNQSNEIEIDAPTTSLSFSPNNFHIAVSTKRSISLWHVLENKLLFKINYENKRYCSTLAWSRRNLICGYNDGSIIVYECVKEN